MGVHWSWAFGQETATQLQTDMGFTVPSATDVSSTITYTYASFPGTKWSLGLSTYNHITMPTSAFTPTGWVTMAAYLDATTLASYTYPIRVFGGTAWTGCYNINSSTHQFYVNGVAKETFAALTHHDWHYWALKYDVSGTTWSGQLFINGVAKTAAYTQAGTASTEGKYMLAGSGGNGTYVNKLAQCIIYNALGDAGETPYFVTRLPPNADKSEVGTWSPASGGTNQVAVTAGDPLDTATYAQEATPGSGANVVTEVNNLIVQLGLTAGTVLGATNHTYSSGTNVQAFASCRDSLQLTYTDGSTITPDSADTTYGYGTTTSGLTGTSTIECKYEIV